MTLLRDETSPLSRALLTLELVQNEPGITAQRLAERLGVSDRAARRYVALLREAEVPIESTRGPYGGYRVGRGLRLPPLMFTAPEALGLVMALVEGPHATTDTDGAVGSALGKIIRVLPERVGAAADTVLRGSARRRQRVAVPDPETTATLIRAAEQRRRVRVRYRTSGGSSAELRDREMDLDPWAVVVRHGLWYLLCWSHTVDAQRVLRVDRVRSVRVGDTTFEAPDDLDPLATVEEHLSEGWKYAVDVTFDAPLVEVAPWFRRSRGRLTPLGDDRTHLTGTTGDPPWFASMLTETGFPFKIHDGPELRAVAAAAGQRLLDAAAPTSPRDTP
jgi:predicted DNA-binding transcriptional regulator YafY